MGDRLAQQEPRRQRAEQRDLQQHTAADELDALGGVGLKDVADHHLVDDGAVDPDEVAGGRGEHQNDREQRLGDRADQRQGREEEVDRQTREHGEAQQERDVAQALGRAQAEQVRPQGQVEDQQAPERDDRRERGGARERPRPCGRLPFFVARRHVAGPV